MFNPKIDISKLDFMGIFDIVKIPKKYFQCFTLNGDNIELFKERYGDMLFCFNHVYGDNITMLNNTMKVSYLNKFDGKFLCRSLCYNGLTCLWNNQTFISPMFYEREQLMFGRLDDDIDVYVIGMNDAKYYYKLLNYVLYTFRVKCFKDTASQILCHEKITDVIGVNRNIFLPFNELRVGMIIKHNLEFYIIVHKEKNIIHCSRLFKRNLTFGIEGLVSEFITHNFIMNFNEKATYEVYSKSGLINEFFSDEKYCNISKEYKDLNLFFDNFFRLSF